MVQSNSSIIYHSSSFSFTIKIIAVWVYYLKGD
nr:MAG TPA: hypothetical protein [Herelleviridae sp.]